MKTRIDVSGAVFITIVATLCFGWLLYGATVQPKSSHERVDPLDGIVYFKNPVTGRLALYISFELVPNREYDVQITEDGVTWSEPFRKSTKGALNDIYYSFNVDPCNGLWPRVVDMGPSP